MDTRAAIERIRCYMNRQSYLRLAIVYGSLAGGWARPDSDLDIAGASAMDIHSMVTQPQLINVTFLCSRTASCKATGDIYRRLFYG